MKIPTFTPSVNTLELPDSLKTSMEVLVHELTVVRGISSHTHIDVDILEARRLSDLPVDTRRVDGAL